MPKLVLLPSFTLIFCLLCGCSNNPSERLARMADEYVQTALSFSPSTATQVGLHKYAGQPLDELLDDVGAASLERQRRFYTKFRERLAAIQPESLGPQDRADYRILMDQVDLA